MLAQIVALIFSIVVRDIINQKYTYLISLSMLLMMIIIQIISLVFKQKLKLKRIKYMKKSFPITCLKDYLTSPYYTLEIAQ